MIRPRFVPPRVPVKSHMSRCLKLRVGGAIWGEPLVSIGYAIKTLVKGMSSLHPILIKIWRNLGKPFKTDSLHEALEVKHPD